MNDGYLGLASGLGSGKKTLIEHLKSIGAITQNAFSAVFDVI